MAGMNETNDTARQNAEFFADNASYADGVATLDTYRRIREALEAELRGTGRLLDIGNGGVFDYDTDLADEIVAADLFLDESYNERMPANVKAVRADAMSLPELGQFDAVLYALVFHHLTGATSSAVVDNVRKTLGEAERVLVPGGRLIVVESCVPPWFYAFERVVFRGLAALAKTPVMRHPATLQLPSDLLRDLIAERFEVQQVRPIHMGRWVLQFGVRWPSALTPARAYLFVAQKTASA
jgi:SAM-dependent methyltransferase